MAQYPGLPAPQPTSQPLEAVHDALFRQQLGLQDFVGNVVGLAGAALGGQQKLLAKVINPLLRTADKRLGFQAANIQEIANALRTTASTQIAEQNIQLAQSVAALPPVSRRTATGIPAAPSPTRPFGSPAASAKSAKKDPLDADPETSGLNDADLLGTTEATGGALAGAASVGSTPGSGETEQPTEDVTNVIALRSCDLRAILDAIQRPRYNPFVDSVVGLPESITAKLESYFGTSYDALLQSDPRSALDALLDSTASAPLEGRVIT